MSTLATVFGYGLLSARAAASVAGRFYYATDTTLMYRDNGSTWDALSVGTGSMATDGLWDAKGDLAAGTGANTGAKLTAGSNGMVPVYDSSQSQGLKTAYPPGYELDYVEFTSNVNITGTSSGTANTIATSASVALDGTAVMVEFFAESADTPAGNNNLTFELWLDGSQLLTFGQGLNSDGANTFRWPVVLKRKLTPSAASHVVAVKGYVNTGTGVVRAGAGTGGAAAPGFLRITKV